MFGFNKKEVVINDDPFNKGMSDYLERQQVEDLKDCSLKLLYELAELKGYYGEEKMPLPSFVCSSDLATIKTHYLNGQLKARLGDKRL